MSIKHAIWKVGITPVALPGAKLVSEQVLENMIVGDPSILSPQWMVIGRQEQTGHGGRIDLLAIAPDGALVLIELKRNRTPREIIAQALDYAAWVEELGSEKIAQIFQRFSPGVSLDSAFLARFGVDLDEEALNQSHQIVIVAAELDESTERIVQYLNDRNIAINVVFFQVFQHGADQLLSRAWLIDPGETQVNAAGTTKAKSEKEPWNGEYYVSFGSDSPWSDAQRYGFISGGGGTWYSQTLKMLSPDDRVWVKIPKRGYVGVGRVLETTVPLDEFSVATPEGERPAIEVLANVAKMKTQAQDPERAEYFVKVQWLDTVPESNAINEVGLFGNQNTVCQPSAPKWRHTVERLKTFFPNWDARSTSPVER